MKHRILAALVTVACSRRRRRRTAADAARDMYNARHGAGARVRDDADEADARRRCAAPWRLRERRPRRTRPAAIATTRSGRPRISRRSPTSASGARPIARPRRGSHAAHEGIPDQQARRARERGARTASTAVAARRRPALRAPTPASAPCAAPAPRRRPRRPLPAPSDRRRPRPASATTSAAPRPADGDAEGRSTRYGAAGRDPAHRRSRRRGHLPPGRDREPAAPVLRPQGRQGGAEPPGRLAQVRRRRREGNQAGPASAEHDAAGRRPGWRRRATRSIRSTARIGS